MDPKRFCSLFPYIELDYQAHLRIERAEANRDQEHNSIRAEEWRLFQELLHQLVDEVVLPRIVRGEAEELVQEGGTTGA